MMLVSWNARPSSSAYFERARVLVAEDRRGQLADHPGHPPAVEAQAGEVEVAGLVEVHLHAVDHLDQLLAADAERRRHGCSAWVTGCVGSPAIEPLDLEPPPGELGGGHRLVADLVDDVVDLAAEGIERGDRAAPFRRQEQEAVVEARAAARRLVLAVLVRRHERLACLARQVSALRSRAGASRQPSLGRAAATSWSSACSRSRICSAPAR